MSLRKRFIGYLGFALVFLVAATVVSARPFRLGVLPDKGAKFSCGTCHLNPGGGGPRNPFGEDYAKLGVKAGDKYTENLGIMDSDKDGVINDSEFDAGTHPGDPASKPAE